MQGPIAFKHLPVREAKLFRISVEHLDIPSLKVSNNSPAMLVSRKATILEDIETGLIDAADIVAVIDGDWTSAYLIVTNEQETEVPIDIQFDSAGGDNDFFAYVRDILPQLEKLSRKTVDRIRAAGVEGKLIKKTKGRWVNSPVNSFTLKVQPKKGNLQFTLYGNPSSYEHGGFLRQDQNSYSRGWVNDDDDSKKLAEFAAKAHARRLKKVTVV